MFRAERVGVPYPNQKGIVMGANVFCGKVARVDLSSGQVEYEKVRDEDAQLYIGARGLGAKYVYETRELYRYSGKTSDESGSS